MAPDSYSHEGMHETADFARLSRALENAIAALPLPAAPTGDDAVRREYLEVLLTLVQVRERARQLGERMAGRARS
jgi:hypothetical protein